MAIVKLWAGRAYGTNTGNLFVKIDGSDNELQGQLRLSDERYGLTTYQIQAAFDGERLTIQGTPIHLPEGIVAGALTASAKLNAAGQLEGEWETEIGTAGTFVLFPHGQIEDPTKAASPDQLHTAHHTLGAIEIDREQLISVADALQQEFKNPVVVTWVAGTEHSRFLQEFKQMPPPAGTVTVVKIRASDLERTGVYRVVQIEFGSQSNSIMTQGGDDAWVLGKREALKRDLGPFERNYATNIKKLGIGINQIIFLGAIAALPDIPSLFRRVCFLFAVVVIALCVNKLHQRYLPNAAIYLSHRPPGLLRVVGPSVISWMIAVTAGVVATLLAGLMDGWLHTWWTK